MKKQYKWERVGDMVALTDWSMKGPLYYEKDQLEGIVSDMKFNFNRKADRANKQILDRFREGLELLE